MRRAKHLPCQREGVRTARRSQPMRRRDEEGEREAVPYAVGTLLRTIGGVRVQACAKGRFFDRMQAKLGQLAQGRGNELVRIDVQTVAAALVQQALVATEPMP